MGFASWCWARWRFSVRPVGEMHFWPRIRRPSHYFRCGDREEIWRLNPELFAPREEKPKRQRRVRRRRKPLRRISTGLIHERTRLAIVSALAVNASLTFNELKELLRVTRRQPERSCAKARGRRLHRLREIIFRPIAEDRIPPDAAGRRALEKYLDHMEALIRATRERLRMKRIINSTTAWAEQRLLRIIPNPKLHVAILLDGNGRWAAARGLPRSRPSRRRRRRAPHRPRRSCRSASARSRSMRSLRTTGSARPVKFCRCSACSRIIFARKRADCAAKAIRLRVIGRRDRIPRSLVDAIESAERITARAACSNCASRWIIPRAKRSFAPPAGCFRAWRFPSANLRAGWAR